MNKKIANDYSPLGRPESFFSKRSRVKNIPAQTETSKLFAEETLPSDFERKKIFLIDTLLKKIAKEARKFVKEYGKEASVENMQLTIFLCRLDSSLLHRFISLKDKKGALNIKEYAVFIKILKNDLLHKGWHVEVHSQTIWGQEKSVQRDIYLKIVPKGQAMFILDRI